MNRERTSLVSTALFIATVCGGSVWSAVAHADSVLTLPPKTEDLTDVEAEQLEEAIAFGINEAGHDLLTEPVGVEVHTTAELPKTANEMRAVGDMRGANYVVVVEIESVAEDRYQALIRVGYSLLERVEELHADIPFAQQNERFEEIMETMLSLEGLGDEAVRLAQATAIPQNDLDDPDDPDEEEEEEELQPEPVPQPAPPPPPPPKAEPEPEPSNLWLVEAGLSLRGVVAYDDRAQGGALSAAEFRFGRKIDAVEGLEVRGGLDIFFGRSNALAFYAGAAYLVRPWAAPVAIGGATEIGLYHSLTGNQVPSFMVLFGGLVSYDFSERFFIEGGLPELLVLSANGGSVAIGASVRAGFRF